MGTCKYCNRSTGLFSHSHKECEDKYIKGVESLEEISKHFFDGNISSSQLVSKFNECRNNNFISSKDIAQIASDAIKTYTDSISRPFRPSQLNLVREYVDSVGIPFELINMWGAIDEFGYKLLKGFMTEYFTDQISLSQAIGRCERVKTALPINREKEDEAYYYVLNKAASNFLSDGLLTDEEKNKIDNFINLLSLQVNNLPAQFKGGELEKLNQVTILKNLEKGVLPPGTQGLPIILGKGETLLWAFNGVTLLEEKITREWKGRSSGFSFRIVKGVYYRTGGIKGKPIEKSSMNPIGIGTLYVTNKNLIFHSMTKGVKISYKKIIGLSPYSDGVEIQRDGANVKRLAIQGFDPWFFINVISLITK